MTGRAVNLARIPRQPPAAVLHDTSGRAVVVSTQLARHSDGDDQTDQHTNQASGDARNLNAGQQPLPRHLERRSTQHPVLARRDLRRRELLAFGTRTPCCADRCPHPDLHQSTRSWIATLRSLLGDGSITRGPPGKSARRGGPGATATTPTGTDRTLKVR
jgi:hypothetical protein